MTADEIEKLREKKRAVLLHVVELRADIERLRAVLRQIADDGKNCSDYCRKQAARALEPKP